jgi:CRP/FNR family cyclic AMP-dependent transcriptional regulator
MTDLTFDIATVDGRRVAFADGGVVFIKGDSGDFAYVVVSGQVDIRHGGHIVEAMLAGELFGEMALIDSEPRSASAVAVGPTELAVIDRPFFERLIREEPAFAMKIMRLMARRLRAMMATQPSSGEEYPVGVPRQSALSSAPP